LALHGPALLAADHLANERSPEVKRRSKGRGKGETKNDQEEMKKKQSSDRQVRRKQTKKRHFHAASFRALSERR
jgi:hypothetical protein